MGIWRLHRSKSPQRCWILALGPVSGPWNTVRRSKLVIDQSGYQVSRLSVKLTRFLLKHSRIPLQQSQEPTLVLSNGNRKLFIYLPQQSLTESRFPQNFHFIVADAEAEWGFPTSFDYIHGRALFSCFKEPLSVFQSAFAALDPGGYFEMQEIYFRPHSNDSSLAGTALEAWNAKVIEGAKILGKDWWCTPRYKSWFEEAGFMDVEEKVFYWPSNAWVKGEKQKELGRTMLANSMRGLSAVSLMVLTKAFGMSVDEIETMLVDVKKDMHNCESDGPLDFWSLFC